MKAYFSYLSETLSRLFLNLGHLFQGRFNAIDDISVYGDIYESYAVSFGVGGYALFIVMASLFASLVIGLITFLVALSMKIRYRISEAKRRKEERMIHGEAPQSAENQKMLEALNDQIIYERVMSRVNRGEKEARHG